MMSRALPPAGVSGVQSTMNIAFGGKTASVDMRIRCAARSSLVLFDVGVFFAVLGAILAVLLALEEF